MIDAALPLVEVTDACKTFPSRGRNLVIEALSDVSLTLQNGEILGIVGESGSGKTTLARCLAGLSSLTSGSVRVGALSWRQLPPPNARRTLAKQLQLVFQDPYTSLNPRMRIGTLVGEGLRVHGIYSGRAQERTRVLELLDRVGLSAELTNSYPRELSGGQRQRVAIARALAVEPELLILDEPVSSLDLSIQAQVLNLIRSLAEDGSRAVMFVSHDLAVVRFVCDRVVVMQDGCILERGPVDEVLEHPEHEFTKELLAAVPGRD